MRIRLQWLVTLALSSLSAAVIAQDYTYITNNGTTTITRYIGAGGDVSIPATIADLPVTAIAKGAFSSCTTLTSVTIPSSVTNIGPVPFMGCSSLSAITVDPLNSFYTSTDGVLFDKSTNMLIECPGGRTGNYHIPESVATIAGQAFDQCSHLMAVTIPDTVSSIGAAAFQLCSSLTNVSIGNTVSSIGAGAFQFCSSLTSITIPGSVTSIGEDAFAGCSSLATVTIPNSVTSIGRWAFFSCSNLTTLRLPDSITNVGLGSFSQCPKLTAVAVGPLNPFYSSVDGVLFDKSQRTLVQCPGAKAGSYAIPHRVTCIEAYAFYGCTSLSTVTIPDSVTTIGEFAFYNCPTLTGVYFQGCTPWSSGAALFAATNAIIYYRPGTIGWGPTFDFRPTAPWYLPNPVILDLPPYFGFQTNQFAFRISWATNATVVVDATTNLNTPTWSPIATNTVTMGIDPGTAGWSDFADSDCTNFPVRFYRARSP